ncbi:MULTISPECIES: hypothetical protein [Achromobacter]|uniref:DUF2970 domain-containing protein n=1 Tax=Achromobacter spanius TaxID=217203 RepID=A0ABY8GUC7_9BURK|nr:MULTISPECIES: hypothetical protein [Achromobacter]WAI82570.1 hypothetical protein N8Z00_24120 [Achromobacter spanius]WEX92655.1 hypothetical protein N3Z32_18720 [Achromobacter sp. SS2-2022]WFP08191.1 hypothetical protein P8T11_28540 [Achromobacter spanius]
MNAITATAPAARRRKLLSITQATCRLTNFIAPRDHAGRGNWNKDADIPRVWAWAAGIGFAAFVLFGRQILGWLLSFAI